MRCSCRSCLVNWFFRPRTDGEEEADGGGEEGNAEDSPLRAQSSESDSRARAVRNTIASASSSAVLAPAREPSESAEELERRRRVEADLWGDLPAPSTSAAAASGPSVTTAARVLPPPPPAVIDSAAEQAEMSADALRRARLARFDSCRRDEASDGIATGAGHTAGVEPVETSTAPAPSERVAALPPRPIGDATTTTAAASTSSAPAPVLFPARVPTGQHRIQNLVCPQCRASCAARAPHRIFALDEVLVTLCRARVNECGTRPRSASPVKMQAPRLEKGKGEGQEQQKGEEGGGGVKVTTDEKDKTWGGLFPGEGGTESSRDRRRRLAQVVRDREDGVRRCGHCNWELDERTGICEGWQVGSSFPPVLAGCSSHNVGLCR